MRTVRVAAAALATLVALTALGAAHTGPRLAIARLQYEGGDWYANPSSLPNLIDAINTRTSLKVEKTEGRVTLLDDRVWDYAFLHVTGHGDIKFSDAEVAGRIGRTLHAVRAARVRAGIPPRR